MQKNVPPVVIVGGGILGLTLGYWLSRSGISVEIFERGHTLGGLAGAMDFGNLKVDRFYHVILPTDRHVIDLAREVGVGERLHFQNTKVGYFDHGQMYSLSSLGEFLRFKPLSLPERARLAFFVVYCQQIKDWSSLDHIPLEDWLIRLCGESLYKKMWVPLLRSKFDDRPENLPATYLWARTRRMSATRDRTAQRESMGCLLGGYQVLADALADKIRAAGGKIHTGVAVEGFEVISNRLSAVHTRAGRVAARQVISTLLPRFLQPLLPKGIVFKDETQYLGIISLMLKMRTSLSPYYTVNITDRSIPFTTVVETTRVIGPENLDGYSLLYVPKYVRPDSAYFQKSDAEIETEFLHHLKRMFPNFHPGMICDRTVVRERAVEPIHGLGAGKNIQAANAVMPGLIQTSTAQIYPALVNCEAVLQVAKAAYAQICSNLGAEATSPILK